MNAGAGASSGMLSIAVLLSGPHRLPWLTQALDSIPMGSSAIDSVLIVHQGGAWDWAPELRQRFESHPKVKVVEFGKRLDFVASFNRAMAAIESDWAMLLPDDDYLMPDAFSRMLELSHDALVSQLGFIAYGWYYARRDSYIHDYLRRYDPSHFQRYAPKFCATLINTRRFRELGGFDARFGGFCDTVLFARLATEFNAYRSSSAVAIYRLHEQQGSNNVGVVYEPYVATTLAALGEYARKPQDMTRLACRIQDFMSGKSSALGRAYDWLNVGLRGREQPMPTALRRPQPLRAHAE